MKNAPCECPKCGSPITEVIGVSNIDASKNLNFVILSQQRRCKECGAVWKDCFQFSYIGYFYNNEKLDKYGERIEE